MLGFETLHQIWIRQPQLQEVVSHAASDVTTRIGKEESESRCITSKRVCRVMIIAMVKLKVQALKGTETLYRFKH